MPTTTEEQERQAFESYTKEQLVDFVMLLKRKLRESAAAKTSLTFDDGVLHGKQLARAKE